MSKQYTPQEVQEAFNGLEKIKDLIGKQSMLPFIIGQAFYVAKKGKYFKKNGFLKKDFLGDTSLSEQSVNVYENIYKCFILVGNCKIEELAFRGDILNRLRSLRPKLFINHKGKLPELKVSQEELQDWINKATQLSTTDFNIVFNQTFNLPKFGEHKCDFEEIIKKKFRCKVCGEIAFHLNGEQGECNH